MTNSTQLEKARAAKQKAKSVFAEMDHLSGIGLTRRSGRYAVKVLLSDSVSNAEAVPTSIDGIPVVFQVVGRVRKQARSVAKKKKTKKRRRTSKTANK